MIAVRNHLQRGDGGDPESNQTQKKTKTQQTRSEKQEAIGTCPTLMFCIDVTRIRYD